MHLDFLGNFTRAEISAPRKSGDDVLILGSSRPCHPAPGKINLVNLTTPQYSVEHFPQEA